MTSTFAELGLSAKVLAAVEAAGYPTPTPIQAQAIPVATTGRDVLGIAQTGTGKTASFVLPMITRLESGRARARMPRSLIMAPTRELAAQVAQSFEKYGIHHKLSVALLIGGVSMDDQLQKLDRGADVLIATPGRLLDHFGRGKLMLMGVEILVIDEADRMLDMGFIPDIEKICKLLPPRRQTLFFSATMPPEITRLVDQFLRDPVRIEVARPATAAKTITQRFRYCESSEDWAKREVLRDLIRELDVKNAIIFCNRKKDVAILLKSLTKHGFNAGALHGDMDQMSRTATLDKFRSGEISLLAASDVAARGLDIPDVSHVINFDVPWQPDDYVHRIGRTGRAGREGYSATIVTAEDVKSIEAIAKLIGEETTWIGEAPDEATLADARTRKRSRGRGGDRGKPESRSRRPREKSPGRDVQLEPARRPERSRRSERPELAERDQIRPSRDSGATGGREQLSRDRKHISRSGSDTSERSERSERPDTQEPVRRERQQRDDDRGEQFASRPRGGESRDTGHRDEPRRQTRGPGQDDSQRDHDSHRNQDPRRGPPRERDAERDRYPRSAERPRERDNESRGSRPTLGMEAPSKGQPMRGDRPQRRPDNRDNSDNRDKPAGNQQRQGLGEHVPAFLRRPVRANID